MSFGSKKSDKEVIVEYVGECAESVEFFAQEFLPHLLEDSIPPFHSEIYELLPNSQRLVIAAPRGFAKSYLCSVIYPIWLICFAKYKDVVIVSASQTLAAEMLRKIKREIEGNQKIIQFFGDMRTDKWSEIHIVANSGVTVRARGAEGQIRGFRPECIIIDDLESDDSVKSKDQTEKLKDWVDKACLPALTPDGQFIMVGSILEFNSLLDQRLEQNDGWAKRRYAAYKDGVEAEGHELWPSRWPHDKLQKKKAEVGSWAFAAEYMNNPISNKSAAIKKEQIRYWEELPQQISYTITVDPAYSEDDKADWKVACLIGIDQNMNRYLVHYIRTHQPQGEFIDAVLNLWMNNKGLVTGLGVPGTGTEIELFRSFVNRAQQRKLYPPFVELKNTFLTVTGEAKRNKQQRMIAALQPLFEQGKYFISKAHVEAEFELLTIGQKQKNDDVVDCMTYAEQIIQPVFLSGPEASNYKATEPPKRMPNYGFE